MKIDFDILDRLVAEGTPAKGIVEYLRVQDARLAPRRTKEKLRQRAKRSNNLQQSATTCNIVQQSATITDFEDFWQRFPNKVGRQAALKAFEKTIKSGVVTLEFLISALDRYCNKTDDRPWCNPATWLNQHRWNDQPAQVIPNGKLTVHQAAANLTARVRALDEPAPSDLCDRAGGGVVRRIPPR
jgi:hypothetical protein